MGVGEFEWPDLGRSSGLIARTIDREFYNREIAGGSADIDSRGLYYVENSHGFSFRSSPVATTLRTAPLPELHAANTPMSLVSLRGNVIPGAPTFARASASCLEFARYTCTPNAAPIGPVR